LWNESYPKTILLIKLELIVKPTKNELGFMGVAWVREKINVRDDSYMHKKTALVHILSFS
jgi:hypothetical protein